MARPETSIGTRTVRGALWAYGSYVGGRLLVLVSTAILARLLTPEDFGLVALAVVFTTLLDRVADLGISEALVVVDEERVDEQARSAFRFSVALATGLAVLVAALSPLAAAFFDEPELAPLLAVLALNFPLRALGATHYALAQKRIDFRSRTAAEVADVVLRGALGIALALLGFGAWSLVLGYLAGTLALVGTLWILVPWRPRLREPRRMGVRDVLRFGTALSGLDILAAIIANVDYLFVGRVLGTASLGYYTLAFRLPELVVMNLSVIGGKVLYPAFATLDRQALQRAFLVALRTTLMIALPMAVVLVVLADPFIAVLFGDQWERAVEPMQVLALYALAVTVGIPAGTAYKAMRRADILLKLAVPRTVMAVAAIALVVDDGIVAVAGAQAGVAALFAAIGVVVAWRLLAVSAGGIARAAAAPLAAAGAMAAAIAPIERALDAPVVELLAGGVAGLAAYVGVLLVVARRDLQDLVGRVIPRYAPVMPAADPAGTAPPPS